MDVDDSGGGDEQHYASLDVDDMSDTGGGDEYHHARAFLDVGDISDTSGSDEQHDASLDVGNISDTSGEQRDSDGVISVNRTDSTSMSTDLSSMNTSSDSDSSDSDSDSSGSNYSAGTSHDADSSDIQKIHKLSILSCFLKHKLSAAASKDMLGLMKKISPESAVLKDIKFETLWNIAGKSSMTEVHYCELCNTVFPDDLEQYRCATHNCPGLRYLGALPKEVFCGGRCRQAADQHTRS